MVGMFYGRQLRPHQVLIDLPSRLAQEPVGRKNRRRVVVLVAKDGQEGFVVHEELRTALQQIY